MIQGILTLAKRKGYVIYSKPYCLNIWGFRTNNTIPKTFDDEIHVFFNVSKTSQIKWSYTVFKCTTDPSTFWLKNPLVPQGTAILNAGQYKDVYQIGLHKGIYKALVQTGAKVKITRDYDHDSVLDVDNGRTEWGYFGINIHRASKVGTTLLIDKYSAGCQVFQDANDFDEFMKLCDLHRSRNGNKFTYTLIDVIKEVHSQKLREKKRNIVTTKSTKIWSRNGKNKTVPKSTILGKYQREKNGITEFESPDAKIQYVYTTSIKFIS